MRLAPASCSLGFICTACPPNWRVLAEAPQVVDGEDPTPALRGCPRLCSLLPVPFKWHLHWPYCSRRLSLQRDAGLGLPAHFCTSGTPEELLAPSHDTSRPLLLPASNTTALFIYSTAETPAEQKPAVGFLQPQTPLSSVLPQPFIPFPDLIPLSLSSPLPLCAIRSLLPKCPGSQRRAEQGMLSQLLGEVCGSWELMLLASNVIKKSQRHNEPIGMKDAFQRHSRIFTIQLVFPCCVLTFWLFVRGVLLGHLS